MKLKLVAERALCDLCALGKKSRRKAVSRWLGGATAARGLPSPSQEITGSRHWLAARECCGYCHADPDCAGAVVSGPVAGGTCTVFHAPPGAPPLRLLNGTAGAGKTACLKR